MTHANKQKQEVPVMGRKQCAMRLTKHLEKCKGAEYSGDATLKVLMTGHINELCSVAGFDRRTPEIKSALAGIMAERPKVEDISTDDLPQLGGPPASVSPAPAPVAQPSHPPAPVQPEAPVVAVDAAEAEGAAAEGAAPPIIG